MFIYVAGPYLPHDRELEPEETQREIDANVEKANQVGLDLAKKGYAPFIPHTMMRNWENHHKVPRETLEDLCDQWVRRCDAFFLIAGSPGADRELALARKLNRPVFHDVADVPDAPAVTEGETLDQRVFGGYLEEYKECMESYRHTYATIWQAGSVLGAVGGAILALGKTTEGTIPPVIQALAPLPILFWYQGIYRPMNRYGELRRKRLADLEEWFRQLVPRMNMQHFTQYYQDRNGNAFLRFFYKPKVNYSVHLLGFGLLAFECYLFGVHVLAPLLRYWGLVEGL